MIVSWTKWNLEKWSSSSVKNVKTNHNWMIQGIDNVSFDCALWLHSKDMTKYVGFHSTFPIRVLNHLVKNCQNTSEFSKEF